MLRLLTVTTLLLTAGGLPADDAKPFPKPLTDGEKAKADGWCGKRVLPKRAEKDTRMGDWKDGKQEAWTPHNLLNAVVKEDRDGFVRVSDGRREGWVSKDEVVPVEDAVAFFDRAVKDRPDDATGWNLRGLGRLYTGDFDNAVKDLSEVVRLRPESSAALNNRGMAWLGKGEHEKAAADFTAAIKLDPKDPSSVYNRGIAWFAKKEYDKAVADYTAAIKLDPKDAVKYESRGGAWYATKEYGKAAADYTAAIRLVPKSPTALNAMAWLLATCPDDKHRDGKRALEYAKRQVAVNPDWWGSYDTLAAAYAEAGDFETAAAEQGKAVERLKADKQAEAAYLKEAEARLTLYRAKKPYREEK